VITSLVSLEHGVYSWEKVTSQRILFLERSGVTSLRDISIVAKQYGRSGLNDRGGGRDACHSYRISATINHCLKNWL
jgi:hypothetical protein